MSNRKNKDLAYLEGIENLDIESQPQKNQSAGFLKILKIIVSVIFWAIMALLVVFSIISIVSKNTPTVFGRQYYAIVSNSMEPEIKTGSLVTVKKIDIDDVEVGDIITYTLETSTGKINITHRVVEVTTYKNEIALVTKGDNLENNDTYYITADMLLGVVTNSTAFVGYLLGFMVSWYGIFSMIMILLIILLASFLVKNYVVNKRYEEARAKALARASEIAHKLKMENQSNRYVTMLDYALTLIKENPTEENYLLLEDLLEDFVNHEDYK